MHQFKFIALFITFLLPMSWVDAQEINPQTYDPLHVEKVEIIFKDLDIQDNDRTRDIPVRLYLPPDKLQGPYPVVLHSHGLGGSRRTKVYLAEHLARRGYICVFIQHPGSDEEVHKHLPAAEKKEALRRASGLKNTLNRIKDVHRVIDELEQWQSNETHELFSKIDLKSIAMTGHSYGAGTTQHVSGQWNPKSQNKLNDHRIKAAIVMSPNTGREKHLSKSFQNVRVPWLLMTGTKDGSPISEKTAESRELVYKNLPEGDKYQIVFWEAEHHAFTDGDNRKKKRNPNHHRAILALSTAFLDAYLKQRDSAKQWLNDKESVNRVLEPKDAWSLK